MGGDKNTSIFISALNKENLDAFKETTYEEVKEIHIFNGFLTTIFYIMNIRKNKLIFSS